MEVKSTVLLLFYIFSVFLNNAVWSADHSEYVAAVVEYYPIQEYSSKPALRLLENAEAYVDLLAEINQQLDIIVFPEQTLHAKVRIRSRSDIAENIAVDIPDAYDGVSLCLNKENDQTQPAFLTALACAAKKFQTYLVLNLIERTPCSDATKCKDGWNLYNTNVVFDRQGAVVSKYRKYNLFGEFYMNQTATPDLSIFETDFGVTFGMFTCFDILFGTPALELAKKHGVTHFVYPTMWFGELPFLTALQAQQQWVLEADAVFLAAGANDPKVGSGGSGIYQGSSGALVFDVVEKGGSKTYVSRVPKHLTKLLPRNGDEARIDETAKKLDSFFLIKDKLERYTSAPILSNQREVNKILCSNDELCCHFDATLEWDHEIFGDGKDHYQYRMVVFSGIRSFSGVYNGGVEVCGIVACVGNTVDTCTYRFNNYDSVSWPVTFKDISIKANFTLVEHKSQHPNSLLSNMRPLTTDAVEWTNRNFVDEALIERSHTLRKPQNRLMTFAIYGRDFSRDAYP